VEIWVSHLLRAGVILSLIIILIGTVVTFWHHRDYVTHSTSVAELTGAGWAFPHDLRAVAASALAGSGRGIVVAGLLVLICTPVMRVALTLVVFLAEKDRAYVMLSAIVLVLLTVSFILGRAGG
jgi:uncharacterized membrane protein